MRIENYNRTNWARSQFNNRQETENNFRRSLIGNRLTAVGKSLFAGRETTLGGNFKSLEPTPEEYNRAIQAEKERLQAVEASPILPIDSTVTKLAKLQIIAENSDYTNMSSEEIYTDIWQRYNEAFDGNLPAIVSCLAGGWEWEAINNQFYDENKQYVERQAVREITEKTGLSVTDPEYKEQCSQYFVEIRSNALGYAGMDYEEKTAAIIQKYSGGKTVLNFLKMQGELSQTGVIAHNVGSAGYLDTAAIEFEKTIFGEDSWRFVIDQQDWNAVLFNDFDVRSYMTALKTNINTSVYTNYDFDVQGVLNKFVDYLFEKLLAY